MIILSIIYIKKYYYLTDDPRHKLTPISTGPHEVAEVNDKTCIILKEENVTERIMLDRLVLAPQLGSPK